MFLTYKIHLMQRLQQTCAVFLHDSVANRQMQVPIHSCLHSLPLKYQLPQKSENNYNELFISILAYLFPINLNINC
jgi:hypothetical protein